MVIGRDQSCEINLTLIPDIKTSHLSRIHARLTLTDSGLTLTDLDSTNGTTVNKVQIDKETALQHGDVITLGFNEFCILKEDREDATIVMGKLNMKDWNSADSAVDIQGFSGSQTVIRQKFELPHGWEKAEDDTLFRAEKYTPAKVAELVSNAAQKQQGARAALVISSGLIESEVFLLKPVSTSQHWKIGRSPNCQIRIPDVSVSTIHCYLIVKNGTWGIKDNDSRNGLYVNLKRQTKCILQDGDKIRLGSVEMFFRKAKSQGA
ncbi:FHA domain protein [Oleiphilus messinensis]|uniref:FHA domain protein n=2 Tax=Oleiphilus messinensis TaxID=141451 RepID=A0A1Y0I5I9_9GAMM|nr:FHA domain protein [Oleiphilus messinensis]